MHQQESKNSRRLVKDITAYGGQRKYVPPQICWGRDNKEIARKYYIENRKVNGESMTVNKTN